MPRCDHYPVALQRHLAQKVLFEILLEVKERRCEHNKEGGLIVCPNQLLLSQQPLAHRSSGGPRVRRKRSGAMSQMVTVTVA